MYVYIIYIPDVVQEGTRLAQELEASKTDLPCDCPRV